MQDRPLDQASVYVRKRVRYDKRLWVDLVDKRFNLADLEPRDHAIKYILIRFGKAPAPHSTRAAEHCHTAI